LQNLHLVNCQPDANFIQWAASRMQILFSRPPAGFKFYSVGRQLDANFCRHGCKFHLVGRQPDENCIWLAALQYKIPKFINSLHAAGDQPNDICIPLAASRMLQWARNL
jgi:hypothetical protein